MRTFLLYVLWLSLCLSAEAKKKHYTSSNTLLAPSHAVPAPTEPDDQSDGTGAHCG